MRCPDEPFPAGSPVPHGWVMTTMTESLARKALAAFAGVHRAVFLDDPAANPSLRVEVIDPVLVVDTPTLVLITPWTLGGLFFPPDDTAPETLLFSYRPHRVHRAEPAELGPYRSVHLLSEVANLADQTQARRLARTLGHPFRAAVAALRS